MDPPELKTEEGYSADIVRTYIPGDICPHNVCTMYAQYRHNVRTMSAQCPHYVRTTSHEGYMSAKYRHNVRAISAQCPHTIGTNVRTISFFGFQLRMRKMAFWMAYFFINTIYFDILKWYIFTIQPSKFNYQSVPSRFARVYRRRWTLSGTSHWTYPPPPRQTLAAVAQAFHYR